MSFEHAANDFRFIRRQWRVNRAIYDEKNTEKLRREILDSNRLRDHPRDLLRELDSPLSTLDQDNILPSKLDLKKCKTISMVAPNCIFFSTSRSIVSNAVATKSRAVGNEAASYAEALSSRPIYLSQFAEWMRAQEGISSEHYLSAKHLQVMRSTVRQFLPGYENLRADPIDPRRLLIDKDGIPLDAKQLSDGERGVLALVLDLARRLSQANPKLDDPLQNGEAIVLIDEIDLHLHPKWQREIVHKLTNTFPKCQFIATTHSPQIIGEVGHDRIQIISDSFVYSPEHSFGIDSSRVLEEIMDSLPRNERTQKLLVAISHNIDVKKFMEARSLLSDLKQQVGENDPEVIRIDTLLGFMENSS